MCVCISYAKICFFSDGDTEHSVSENVHLQHKKQPKPVFICVLKAKTHSRSSGAGPQNHPLTYVWCPICKFCRYVSLTQTIKSEDVVWKQPLLMKLHLMLFRYKMFSGEELSPSLIHVLFCLVGQLPSSHSACHLVFSWDQKITDFSAFEHC